MAVQIPDPGTGNGQTGDNEYVFRKKVKDNFTDQTNAASRLVGPEPKNLMEVGAFGLGAKIGNTRRGVIKDMETGFFSLPYQDPQLPAKLKDYDGTGFVIRNAYTSDSGVAVFLPYWAGSNNQICVRSWRGENNNDFYVWTDRNTTKDSNGFLKAASPIVKVFADKVELNDDAANQNVTFKKNGVGDYTITTQSGLSTDGWYIELPKDMNGNPKVAIGTLDDKDGVITLKTYKRIFNTETSNFEPDLDSPLDIPDGRWIDLRLNEIPVEPSEPESEV